MATSVAELRRSLIRVALAGCSVGAALILLGSAAEYVRLGPSEAAALAKVEREVRATFDRQAAELRDITQALAARPVDLERAATDETATRSLFDQADATLNGRDGSNLAVTAYDLTGNPLAWSGRPSELPRDRVTGPLSLFVAPGPLGPRLVYVEPVTAGDNRRIATIAAERVLAPPPTSQPPIRDGFVLQTALAPVALRTRYEGAGEGELPDYAFEIATPTGETLLEARVSMRDLTARRREWRRTGLNLLYLVLAITCLACCGPLLDWSATIRSTRSYVATTIVLTILVLVARGLLWMMAPGPTAGSPVLTPDTFISRLILPLVRTPLDFLLTALTCLALLAIASDAIERWRLAARLSALRTSGPRFALAQFAHGFTTVLLVIAYQRGLDDVLRNSAVDLLHFSIHPLDLTRLSLDCSLILFFIALLGASIALGRLVAPRRVPGALGHPASIMLLRALPAALVLFVAGRVGAHVPVVPTAFTVGLCLIAAQFAGRVIARLRHATQATRLTTGLLACVVPGLALYPTILHFADEANRRLIETQLAPQAARQRDELQFRLRQTIGQIDRLSELPDLVQASATGPGESAATDTAFAVWSQTDLARHRLTSAVELYGVDGKLVSRFALNLPEYTSTPPTFHQAKCEWDVFEEAAPFGADDRRLLHASRALCRGTNPPRPLGAIVVHVMLDYNTLPFISSQSPYFELFRTDQPAQQEGVPGRDVEFVVYGWGRMPIYTSEGRAWALSDELFARLSASRASFWTTLERGDRRYAVYFTNERAGIYALGYPTITALGHLVDLAELTTLAALAYLAIMLTVTLLSLLGSRRATSGRALLREIRASFYRKLFLAFVAASVVPVLTLAFVTRAYIAGQLRDGVESAATRTAAVARRVVEEYATLQQRGSTALPFLDDDVMVWISRLIDQDVNVFVGTRLVATSERDLFASGLLPTRTPGNVYRAIALQHLPSFVGDEEVGDFRYLLAAGPVQSGNRGAILTVPLTLRQQEIEREIDELDRRVLLAALLFILFGAFIGYSMAERIADPVNRLTRATRRIARGDFDARIAARSSDELRTLVVAFNGMASELQRQRQQLQRTNRLEAWAEMARQVAHEIKNPLTPIQLSAEHLLRVHADRGQPLSPVLEDCVHAILGQVRLLRQISAEFSSFASSPTARPTLTAPSDLIDEVMAPYRTGLSDRFTINVNTAPSLPVVAMDKTLIGRTLTNVVENALHAMPAGGTLTIAADEDRIRKRLVISITDTGVGLDEDGLRHVFEPYFSTKATGTGLGLTIARRNVELHGGTIAVRSARGQGTTVTIELPIAP